MKFSEKLQKLRKENKLSQEQLADMLDVSRQAVSKWESGQTYPEMDKLLALCKIFKCSLDDLTNDEVKEIKNTEKTKLTASNFIDEVMDIINRSIQMFQKMNAQEILKCIIGMLIIAFILRFLKFPVDYIYSLGHDIFISFGTQVSNILSPIWNFLLSVSYLILAIICFFYLYKLLFLEKWEKEQQLTKQQGKIKEVDIDMDTNDQTESSDEKSGEEKKEKQEKVIYAPRRERSTSLITKILGTLFTFFVKFCLACILIPFLISFVCLVFFIVIGIVLIFQGIPYIGILLLLLSCLLLNYCIVSLVLHWILNQAPKGKLAIFLFILSLVGIGISGAISAIEISNTTYYDRLPEQVEMKTMQEEYSMTPELFVKAYAYAEINYHEDDSLADKVRVEIEYADAYNDIEMNLENNVIYINQDFSLTKNRVKEWKKKLLSNLKERTIYNYGLLEKITVNITASKENIERIQQNEQEYHLRQEEEMRQEEINSLEATINDLELQIESKQQEIDELRTSNEEKDAEIMEYQTKLEEYKNQLRELLAE